MRSYRALLSTIRVLGRRPCVGCLVWKKDIPKVGSPGDLLRRRRHKRLDNQTRRSKIELARKLIYVNGARLKSKKVEDILGKYSMVPTRVRPCLFIPQYVHLHSSHPQNAFSEKLSRFGFDFHTLFTPDLLHEFEIGVWKGLFAHLIRILHAASTTQQKLVVELDSRCAPLFEMRDTFANAYHFQISSCTHVWAGHNPPFHLQPFRTQAAGCSRLRGFVAGESNFPCNKYCLLISFQCAMPAFDGLLPEPHNAVILDLLFLCGTWHAYAKLRLHTDSTLASLDLVGRALCQAINKFVEVTCNAYKTKALPKESAARARRSRAGNRQTQQPPHKKQRTTQAAPAIPDAAASEVNVTEGMRKYNQETIKAHGIPDYPPASTLR